MNGKERETAIWLSVLLILWLGTGALRLFRATKRRLAIRRILYWLPGWIVVALIAMVLAPIFAGAKFSAQQTQEHRAGKP